MLTLSSTVTYKGMGRDIWTVPSDDITTMLKVRLVIRARKSRQLTFHLQIFYIEQYIYQLVIVMTKISIVLLYLRIFPKEASRRFQYVSWAVFGGLVVYLVAFLIYFACECEPISFFWT